MYIITSKRNPVNRRVIKYPMYIKLQYALNQTITIKLFDNPAVIKWFNCYQGSRYQQSWIHTNKFKIFKFLQPLIYPGYNSKRWNTIKSTLSKLEQLGYNIPFKLPVKFTDDQNLLNQLHRFFTYNVLWHQSSQPNPYDKDFTTDLGFQEWHDLLDKINTSVHFLELSSTTNNRKILDRFPISYIWINLKKKSFDTVLEFDETDQQENYKYFANDPRPLVLLDGSILGKSVLQSFLDNDDPTCKDCSGRTVSHGGFMIDLNNSRSQIYSSKEFLAWTEKFKLGQLPLEFPIGYVTNPEKLSLVSKLALRDVLFLASP